MPFRKGQALRYGENPHQSAALYLPAFAPGGSLADHRQVQGKELSFNNLNDADAALELVAEFRDGPPTVVIVKHANPCGVASGDDLVSAYMAALQCDSVSAFGGIIAVNRPLDGPTAEAISDIFTEVVCAPDADEAAKAVFAKKKSLRLILTGELWNPARGGIALRTIAGGALLQSRDNGRITREDLKVVTKRAPTEQELTDCLFAWTVAKHVKSNAIVYAKDGATAGIGAGQMNRRDSARIAAAARSGGNLWLGRAAHGRLVGRLGRVLPVCRWAAGGGRGGRDGGDPAGRVDARRRGDRRRRRGGPGDGIYRHAALPPLTCKRPAASTLPGEHLIGHDRGGDRSVQAVRLAEHRDLDQQVALRLIG